MFIDTHCHLNSDELLKEIEQHIKEAEENNVRVFIVVGWNKSSSFKAVELSKKYNGKYLRYSDDFMLILNDIDINNMQKK